MKKEQALIDEVLAGSMHSEINWNAFQLMTSADTRGDHESGATSDLSILGSGHKSLVVFY